MPKSALRLPCKVSKTNLQGLQDLVGLKTITMKKFSIWFLVFTIISCSSETATEDVTIIEETANEITFQINGEKSVDDIVQVNAFYSCGSDVSVSVTSKKDHITSDLINFDLTKEGELKSIFFTDKSKNFKQYYKSPDFIPASTITISEFEFIEDVQLSFKYKGQLFKQTHNLRDPNETIDIEGTVDIKLFSKSICNVFGNFLKLNNQIRFENISKINDGTTIRYEANSLNGYHIKIQNFSQNIPDMPLGTYSFTNSSESEKIAFRKYIGVPKFFSTHILLPDDWEVYDTEGSFTIVEKTRVNGFEIVRLKLNFMARLNGTVVYQFIDADFETAF